MYLLGIRSILFLTSLGKKQIQRRKASIESGSNENEDDILSMMLNYEKENPDYTIEEQIDDFLTFIVAGA